MHSLVGVLIFFKQACVYMLEFQSVNPCLLELEVRSEQ